MSDIDLQLPEPASFPANDLTPAGAAGLAAPPATPRPTLRRLLFGDDGLRAGWSLLVFLLLMALTVAAITAGARHFLPPPTRPVPGAHLPMTARSAGIGEILQFAVIAIPSFLMSVIERRPFGRYGLPARRLLPDFAQGLGWGLVLLSTLIAALLLSHSLSFTGVLLHGPAALAYAGKWGLVFFGTGLGEEFIFRGYLQFTLARGAAGILRAIDPQRRHAHALSFTIAAAVFSVVLFMAAHLGNGGETAPGIAGVGLAGMLLAFSLWRTGSLWWGIGFHTTWDWAQSYLYGVADSGTNVQGHLLASHPMGRALLSGGSDGPEGSLFVIPVLLLAGLIVHLTLPYRPRVLTADQAAPAAPQPALP